MSNSVHAVIKAVLPLVWAFSGVYLILRGDVANGAQNLGIGGALFFALYG